MFCFYVQTSQTALICKHPSHLVFGECDRNLLCLSTKICFEINNDDNGRWDYIDYDSP